MKEKIEQLSRGEFNYELPKILLSEEELLITVEIGSTYTGSFTISNSNSTRMKGVLYSSSRYLKIDTDRFIGEENIIEYHVVGDCFEVGECVTCTINIIADCGEVVLPVQILAEEPGLTSSVGKIKDMFHFTNLASTDWAEAKQLFKTDKLAQIINYYDNKHSLLYQALRKSSGMSQAMDEFLVAIRKKLEVKITANKTNFEYEVSKYSFMDKIVLTKEGWGYSQIRISTDATFIELDRKLIWADNFINNTYDLNFVLKVENMKDGIHTGKIFIKTIHQSITIFIKVICARGRVRERIQRRIKHQYSRNLLQNYLEFRLNKISASKYATEAESLLAGLELIVPDDNFLKLYHSHVDMIAGKEAKAKETLEAIEALDAPLSVSPSLSSVDAGVLAYLQTLLKNENVDILEITGKIRELYKRESGAWILLWCLLYLDKAYDFNKQKKYDDIKEECTNGCMSPVLYYEAAFLINEEPSIMKNLELFELRVLAFGFRRQFFSKDLARQVTYLAAKAKGNGRLLLLILKLIYERFQLKEALMAICTILIRNHRTDAFALSWYRLGIEEQLRITELPEYYLYSIDEENYEELTPSILTYFAYNNKLPDRKKAYLFANIIRNKDRDPATYKVYEKIICEYALQKLSTKSIHRHLAVIYDEVLHHVEIEKEIAANIPEIAFYYQLQCTNPNIRSVAVVHKELKGECIVPLVEGRALIELITENAEIFLLDEKGCRYYVTVDYTIHKLLHLDDLYMKCYEIYQGSEKLLLHLSEKVQNNQKFDLVSIDIRKRVVSFNNINEELRIEYIKTLIYHYYDNFQGEVLESYLSQIDLHTLHKDDRNKMIEIMIIRDMYNPVIQALSEFGYEEIDIKRLLKICSRIVMNSVQEPTKIDIVVEVCHYVFTKGKYDEAVLNYLVSYFYGTTKEMYEIWTAAKNFDVDTIQLEDRLLAQMLFAESYLKHAIPVFMSYYRSGFNRKLMRAFLSYYAYKYLVKDRIPEPELFDVMKREVSYESNEICLLALLKYYSSKEVLADSEINFVEYHLNGFEQKNIVLPFFKDFSSNMRIPQNMYDKYYVEYRTDPKNKVCIHYLLEGEAEKQGFVTEEMVNVCYGIFIKEFVIFNNESLQYYISEENETSSNITLSTDVQISPEPMSTEETKFHQLNMILAAREMKDELTINKMLDQYVRVDYAISQLFKPI